MLGSLARKAFGTPSERRVKEYRKRLPSIAAHEADLAGVSDGNLAALTRQLRDARAAGKEPGYLLPYAFATAREGARRVLGLRAFDVQLVGAMALQAGCVAEMRTGEGKTLVAAIAAYLAALDGDGVHVVTANDYLARRDHAEMGPVLAFLGLTVGLVVDGMDDAERRLAYACDVTYATNSQLAFDHLRDNMRDSRADRVQRGFAHAIVDEVDSILIDEARSPLIISGPGEDRSAALAAVDAIVAALGPDALSVDRKAHTAVLTEEGTEAVEAALRAAGLLDGEFYDAANAPAVHAVNQAVVARGLYRRDHDYVVRDGAVVIIDPHTGRAQPERRFSDGLHQAIEAKESVAIQRDTRTLASVTYQNFFRLYGKLSGMTGTAATEADEFLEIYGLEVVTVPTNLPVARLDEEDEVHLTRDAKLAALVAEVGRAHARGQPVLVGTGSVEQSEAIADLLAAAGFTRAEPSDPAALAAARAEARAGRPPRLFSVLNANRHEGEALVVAEAGAPGAITVATNMAGRGTDIKLGGNAEARAAHALAGLPEGTDREHALAAARAEVEADRAFVLAAGEPAGADAPARPGGLYVIGAERHESRRIDDQLRGRSGRQGDPGRSRFFLSLQDELVRTFAGPTLEDTVASLGLRPGEAISHPWVTSALEKAQGKVEARNFQARKDVLKYDDVIDAQRKVVFRQRDGFLDAEDLSETVAEMRAGTVEWLAGRHLADDLPENWALDALAAEAAHFLGVEAPLAQWAAEEGIGADDMAARLLDLADAHCARLAALDGPELRRRGERHVLLNVLDDNWRGHLDALEHLRHAVAMRGYAQRDPLQEFRTDAYTMFDELIGALGRQTTSVLGRNRFADAPEAQAA